MTPNFENQQIRTIPIPSASQMLIAQQLGGSQSSPGFHSSITAPESRLNPSRHMKDLTPHFKFLALATFVAYRALCNLETPVACLLVDKRTGKILSYGCNDTNASLNGTRHAEFVAIDRVLEENHLVGASLENISKFFSGVALYVTVEPCVMCASALQQLGIGEVFFGAANDRFGGNGSVIKVQQSSIPNYYASFGGIMRTEAVYLLRCFYIQENESAPVPKIKKNKDIEGKSFPPNIPFDQFLTETEFVTLYGSERLRLFFPGPAEDIEMSPLIGKGYRFHELVDAQAILSIPHVKNLYPKGDITVEEDIQALDRLLPFIDDDGKVRWNV
ncbi:tRNA(adenine34) deaminase [Candidozyma auris]|nr:hypothetical protein QG37_00725 [[Candida] auris]